MATELAAGMAAAISAAFPACEIYQGQVEQGLKPPCFLLAADEVTQTPLLGGRFFRRTRYSVHYFPKEKNDQAAMLDTAERLTQALEWVTLPGGRLLRGVGVSYGTADGVLRVQVSYSEALRRTAEQAERMESLTALSLLHTE